MVYEFVYLPKPVDNFDLSLNITEQDPVNNCGFMSVDQTFHTPSFGDEEFEIPPLTLAPAAAATRCSGQGVFGNQVPVEYFKRRFNGGPIYVYLPQHNTGACRTAYGQHQQQNSLNHHSLQQTNNLIAPSHSPQRHSMESPQAQLYQSPPQQSRGLSPPQEMYQNTGETMVPHSMNMQMQSYDGRTTYSNASGMHQNTMQPPQMSMMQQQSPPHHMGQMGPPQQQQQQNMFSNMNQSQMGMQMGMGGPSPHNQGSGGSMGSSPPGSNHNSPGLETSEDSDDSTPLAQLIGGLKRPSPEPVDTTTVKVTKKPKPQKKKKKRDPNEPQKPVSAYALFFRDTQAAIKGQNPNASFGEVSKIVASMWDSLDAENKNIYKKRTEAAKKDYLKRLAAYRATLVSKAAVDQSDSVYGNNTMGSSSPPATNSPPSHSPPGHMMSPMHKKSPVLTSMVDSMQPVTTMSGHPSQQVVTNQQVWHMQQAQQQQQQPVMSHNSPPHMMHGSNMVNMHQQQMQLQQTTQPQMMTMNRPPGPQISAVPPQICTSASNSPTYQQTISPASAGGARSNLGNNDMMTPLQTCLRNGCSNPAVDSPDWDREYCSSECVVSHCRDVFTAWVASRQVSTAYSTVK